MIREFHHRVLRTLAHHHGLERLAVRAINIWRPEVRLPVYRAPDCPPPDCPPTGRRGHDWPAAPVFATSRFRSGSTLLWQALDRVEGIMAYYEPLNERRWFDPAVRGRAVDTSHRGTTDYSRHYDDLTALGRWYDVNWTTHHLAMDVKHKNSDLIHYIKYIISESKQRPVLQFNRIDFRLGFLRKAFPDAVMVHLMRNCRDVWRSSLKGVANDPDWTLADFEPHAHFYLVTWYRDLVVTFPGLLQDSGKTHPYLVHVLIERLSQLFAYQYADIFLRYEDLCSEFLPTMDTLLTRLHWRGTGDAVDDWSVLDAHSIEALRGLMSPRVSPYDHSADTVFYEAEEAKAEQILQAWLPAGESSRGSLG